MPRVRSAVVRPAEHQYRTAVSPADVADPAALEGSLELLCNEKPLPPHGPEWPPLAAAQRAADAGLTDVCEDERMVTRSHYQFGTFDGASNAISAPLLIHEASWMRSCWNGAPSATRNGCRGGRIRPTSM